MMNRKILQGKYSEFSCREISQLQNGHTREKCIMFVKMDHEGSFWEKNNRMRPLKVSYLIVTQIYEIGYWNQIENFPELYKSDTPDRIEKTCREGRHTITNTPKESRVIKFRTRQAVGSRMQKNKTIYYWCIMESSSKRFNSFDASWNVYRRGFTYIDKGWKNHFVPRNV